MGNLSRSRLNPPQLFVPKRTSNEGFQRRFIKHVTFTSWIDFHHGFLGLVQWPMSRYVVHHLSRSSAPLGHFTHVRPLDNVNPTHLRGEEGVVWRGGNAGISSNYGPNRNYTLKTMTLKKGRSQTFRSSSPRFSVRHFPPPLGDWGEVWLGLLNSGTKELLSFSLSTPSSFTLWFGFLACSSHRDKRMAKEEKLNFFTPPERNHPLGWLHFAWILVTRSMNNLTGPHGDPSLFFRNNHSCPTKWHWREKWVC